MNIDEFILYLFVCKKFDVHENPIISEKVQILLMLVSMHKFTHKMTNVNLECSNYIKRM